MTSNGYKAILSAPWYLNYIDYGSDWTKYYKVDPMKFGGKDEDVMHLLGGEVKRGTLNVYKQHYRKSSSKNIL